MINYTAQRINEADRFLFDRQGNLAGIQNPKGGKADLIPANYTVSPVDESLSLPLTVVTSITANSSSAALTVTQTGAGNAFVVEDSASTDSTPFVIDASGIVGIGTSLPSAYTSAGLVLASSAASSPVVLSRNSTVDANASAVILDKERSGAIVTSGNTLGSVQFRGFDGAAFLQAALIKAEVDGTPGTNDMPGRLIFSTTADGAASPTERMRIDSAGSVGLGGAAQAFTKMYVTGTLPSSGTASRSLEIAATVPSTSTAQGFGFYSALSTQAAAFTLTSLEHFRAGQGTIGAASAVTNQFGFHADSTLTGATNNYGFYSNIASAANRFNFYAAGTATNFFTGIVSGGTGSTWVGDAIIYNATAVPAGGIGGVGYKFSTTSNFGVFFGSGAPTLSAAQGSLYLRSDGSSTSTRLYVNTNGTTGWTNVTTAA